MPFSDCSDVEGNKTYLEDNKPSFEDNTNGADSDGGNYCDKMDANEDTMVEFDDHFSVDSGVEDMHILSDIDQHLGTLGSIIFQNADNSTAPQLNNASLRIEAFNPNVDHNMQLQYFIDQHDRTQGALDSGLLNEEGAKIRRTYINAEITKIFSSGEVSNYTFYQVQSTLEKEDSKSIIDFILEKEESKYCDMPNYIGYSL